MVFMFWGCVLIWDLDSRFCEFVRLVLLIAGGLMFGAFCFFRI